MLHTKSDAFHDEAAATGEGSANAPHVGPIAMNTRLAVHDMHVRVMGCAGDRLVMASLEPPHALFVVAGDDGTPALPTHDQLARWLATGEARRISEEPVVEPRPRHEAIVAALRLVDGHGVPNGTKAIAVALHRHWTPAMTARLGPPPNAVTVRRWRGRRKPPSD